MDVDASLDDVLAALDVDADMNVGSDADADVDTDVDSIADAGADVEVDVDSVAEDGELEPVVAVTLMPTVIKKQIISEVIPFLHVLKQGRRTQRSCIIKSSRCRKDEIYGVSGTTSPRSLKNRVTKRRASNIGYARIGAEQE